MSRIRRVAGLVAAATICAVTPEVAADESLCRQLEAQLARIETDSGDTRGQDYAQAIVKQRQELDMARDRAWRMGCDSAMATSAIASCATLNATIARMQQNLLDLEVGHAQLVGGDSAWRERARLEATLELNGCRDGRDLPGVVDGRDGGRIAIGKGSGQRILNQSAGNAGNDPVSTSVEQPDASDREEQAEEAGESGSVITLGEPEPQAVTKPRTAQPFEQPEPDRRVRVVGPRFLPDPEEAIDLQVPDPKPGR